MTARFLRLLLVTVTLAVAAAGSGAAFTIDGDVLDWNIDLSASGASTIGFLNSNLPSGGNHIQQSVEDNADESALPGGWRVGPQFSAGNRCDAEALYFDNDASNLYLAVISGLPFGGADLPYGWYPGHVFPGDLGIDIDGDLTYDFAVDFDNEGLETGAVLRRRGYWMPGCVSPLPYAMAGGTVVSPLDFAYGSGTRGHYVIETAIPLDLLGLAPGDTVSFFWSMSCGNDFLSLNAQVNPAPTPEASTLFLMLSGLAGSLIPLIRRRYNQFRRFLDIILSIVALIITSPVLLLAAILIKMDSRGPVFYKQVRVGINRRSRDTEDASAVANDRRSADQFGKPFTIYKLRTMRADAEKHGARWASVNDIRVTRIGLFLRKTRIDEIPQFLNVLKGDMSIIGPRPERPIFVRQLNESIKKYNRRFDIKPGITGLAQVRYQYASSVEDTKKKLKYDLLYAKKRSLSADIRIFFNTIRTILFARGSR